MSSPKVKNHILHPYKTTGKFMLNILVLTILEITGLITNASFKYIPRALKDLPLEIHFLYLGIKEIYCIFNIRGLISV
jgi:hypothetical protein